MALSDQWEPTSPVLAVFTSKSSEWLSQTSWSLFHRFWQFSLANVQSGSLRPLGATFTCAGHSHLQMLRVACSDQCEPISTVLAAFTCKCLEWLFHSAGILLQLLWQFSPATAKNGTPMGSLFTCFCSFHLQMLSGSLRPVDTYFTCSGTFHLQRLRVALSDQLEPTSPVLAVFTCKC